MLIWSLDFLTLAILAFAIVLFIVGLVAVILGSGKSKGYGGVMTVAGLVVIIVMIWLEGFSGIEPWASVPIWDVFYNGLIYLIGVLVGAIVAVVIFLVAILKG